MSGHNGESSRGANGVGGKARDAFGLVVDAYGRLVLIDADGRRHVGVEPVRAFPISDPARYISLVGPEGREIAHVEDLAALATATRQVLEAELARREFVPVIQRIVRSSTDVTPADWDVITDRGPVRLTLDSEGDLRKLDGDRVLVTDARGLRYLIADVRALDVVSRRVLERFL